jgi:hypothetical protein
MMFGFLDELQAIDQTVIQKVIDDIHEEEVIEADDNLASVDMAADMAQTSGLETRVKALEKLLADMYKVLHAHYQEPLR